MLSRTISTTRQLLCAALTACFLLTGTQVMAIEEPGYEVVRAAPDFELRRYKPYLVAETEVSGDFDDVGNTAFRVLADYIFGNNTSATKLEMTAPVNQRPAQQSGEKIAMAAPVTQRPAGQAADGQSYVVSFVMPSGFTLETLPKPKSPNIHLRQEPSRLMAVNRYSGRWTKANYQEHEKVLLEAVKAAGLRPVGTPVYARYNPPFTPWFMRRNEVMVEVAEPANQGNGAPGPG